MERKIVDFTAYKVKRKIAKIVIKKQGESTLFN